MPNDKLLGAKVNVPYCIKSDGTEQVSPVSMTLLAIILRRVLPTLHMTLKSWATAAITLRLERGPHFISQHVISLDINYMISTPTSTDFPTQDTLNFAFGLEHYWQPYLPSRFDFIQIIFLDEDANGEQINTIGVADPLVTNLVQIN